MKEKMKMPVLFIGHGSPMNAVEDNNYTRTLKRLGDSLPRPRAILMISAHWETSGTRVTGMERPRTIHDFYGFPEELYQIQYEAPGDPSLAEEISSKTSATIEKEDWGLDHGTWTILKHMYPGADIPVLQMSLDKNRDMAYHFKMGEKIKGLREQGVLIIGSGNIVHNLKEVKWKPGSPAYQWSIDFDEWCKGNLRERNFSSLIEDPFKTDDGRRSHPTIEHYLPLLYTIGASDVTDDLVFEYEGIQNGSISMTSFVLGVLGARHLIA